MSDFYLNSDGPNAIFGENALPFPLSFLKTNYYIHCLKQLNNEWRRMLMKLERLLV